MYVGEEVAEIPPDEFIQMMVVDGCFIIEHLINVAAGHEEPSLHATPFGPAQLSVDLVLAENQMPFFLLVDLIASTKLPEFEASGHPAPVLLVKLVLYYLGSEKGRDMSEELPPAEGVSHVLHLLHEMVTAARTRWEPPPSATQDTGWAQAAWRLVRRLPSMVLVPLLYRIVPESRRRRVWEDVPSASDLKRMRVKFKKASRRVGTTPVADIALLMGPVPLAVKLTEDGQLQLPQLLLEARTAPLLLNLMAFEQSWRVKQEVSPYAAFMAKLVQTAEDAGLLAAAKVLQHGNESMDEVAKLFRMLGVASEAGAKLETSYLSVTLEELRRLSQSWADVERHYFTLLAELLALVTFVSGISTIVQTYAAFKYH
ncbi:hypothetical protein VPH35_007036 [Triticum aestivum]|uniref:uncharacterized protein n=1 Tax=Triticum aestivum TaxID=4565 RepID=UPI00084512E0|nr:uncharacterized protein LOC123087518 [Triticum aestivum]